MKTLRKWWFLLVPLGGLAIYLYSIKDRLFESAEQRVEMVNEYNNSPSAVDKWKALYRDSVTDAVHKENDSHAIVTRQARYEDGVRKDSIRAINDSTILEYVKRNANQFYQMNQSLDSIKAHH